MMQDHNYALTELENMIPWEREIYLMMLIDHMKEEERRHKERQQKQ